MTSQTSQVQYGTTTIGYRIRRTGRKKTVAITIEPAGKVLVTAPATTSRDRLDRIVHRKARWIVTRLRRVQGLPPPLPRREFVSGETYVYLGRQYRLRVVRLPSAATTVSLTAGWFEVVVDSRLSEAGRRAAVRRALVGWYRRHAEVRLAEAVAAWSERMHIAVPPILLREQRLRWASCDRHGVVRFNWRIIQAPRRLLDYVVAHELLHLGHPHHTSAFWSALGHLMPDYEKRKAELRTVGARLGW